MAAINVDYAAPHKYFVIDVLVPELREEISKIPTIEYWYGEKQQTARYALSFNKLPHLLEFLEKYRDYVEVTDEALTFFPNASAFKPDAKIVLQDRIKTLEEELSMLRDQETAPEGVTGQPGSSQEDVRPPRRGPGRPKES